MVWASFRFARRLAPGRDNDLLIYIREWRRECKTVGGGHFKIKSPLTRGVCLCWTVESRWKQSRNRATDYTDLLGNIIHARRGRLARDIANLLGISVVFQLGARQRRRGGVDSKLCPRFSPVVADIMWHLFTISIEETWPYQKCWYG